jgi:hypothetical protein
LRHIGAGGERLVPGSGQDQHLDRSVGIGGLTDFGQPLVHRELMALRACGRSKVMRPMPPLTV